MALAQDFRPSNETKRPKNKILSLALFCASQHRSAFELLTVPSRFLKKYFFEGEESQKTDLMKKFYFFIFPELTARRRRCCFELGACPGALPRILFQILARFTPADLRR